MDNDWDYIERYYKLKIGKMRETGVLILCLMK